MFPVLYEKDETDFNNNGLGILAECTECIVTEERNGAFECMFSYPVASSKFYQIAARMIIKVKADNHRAPQLFRIYKIEKPKNGIGTFYCNHISYDLSGFPLENVTSNGNFIDIITAWNKIITEASSGKWKSGNINFTELNKFTFLSDLDTRARLNLNFVTLRSAIGGTDGSLLDGFGGELEFDNFKITMHESRGSDNGVVICYGKNLQDISLDTDFSEVYTGIFGYYTTKDNETDETHYTTLLNTHGLIKVNTWGEISGYSRILIQDFTQELSELGYEEDQFTRDLLESRVDNWVDNQNRHLPDISATIDFIHMGDYFCTTISTGGTNPIVIKLPYDELRLCDTVYIRYEKADINISTKIIKVEYDAIREKYKKMEIGTVRARLTDRFI